MNRELWTKILEFKIDNPDDEYGFVTRLAIENSWTLSFAKSAITEYKKFFYLAANYNEMVSPSEIVDIVWHQHLLFTTSYDDFCKVASKKIEHIPSTHNAVEKEKFGQAKFRTKELYEKNFDKQPNEFWNFKDELDSLPIKRSKINLSNSYPIQILALIGINTITYYLIKPLLLQIGNPDFLIYYLLFCGLSIFILEFVLQLKFKSMIKKIKTNPIISNLSAFELIYLQKNKINSVVHGIVNNLIADKKIEIQNNKRLNLIDENLTDNQYSNTVIKIMSAYDPIPYQQLIKLVSQKPIFNQIQKSVDKIKQHIDSSINFQSVFIFAFIYMSILISIGLSRLALGLSREKPVLYISFVMTALVLLSVFYLKRIKNYLFIKSIPDFYKNEIVTEGHKRSWEWNYFVFGEVLFVTSFIPLIDFTDRKASNVGTGCGTSCGSSCGSSCGGGCGGCGGH